MLGAALLAMNYTTKAVAAVPNSAMSAEMPELVDKAIKSYAGGNGIADIYSLTPFGDRVLPLLPRYLAAPDAKARDAAALIASIARTDAAITLLAPSFRSNKVGIGNFMFSCFDPESVRTRGGKVLRDNLIWSVLHDNSAGANSVHPLLLAAYVGDPVVTEFLKGLQRREIAISRNIVSMPPILHKGEEAPRIIIPDLGANCCGFDMPGWFVVPYEFTLHLALAELHEKSDEEAVLWRLRRNDLPSIEYTLSCARYVTNKRLLLALVELVKNDTLTKVLKPNTLGGTEITEASYMRVCDYAAGMLTSTLQVDVGIQDLTAVALKKRLHGYQEIDYNSIGPVRQYSTSELNTAYTRLKAAVEKMPDK